MRDNLCFMLNMENMSCLGYNRKDWRNDRMKFKWDKKYLYWGITALIVSAIVILFNYFVNHNESVRLVFSKLWKILAPIIDGIVIAFLIDPLVKWFENKFFPLFNKKLKNYKDLPSWHKKLVRILSLVLSYILLLFFAFAFFVTVVPQLRDSVMDIYNNFPKYKLNFEIFVNRLTFRHPELKTIVADIEEEYSDAFITWRDSVLLPWVQGIVAGMSVYVLNTFSAIWNLIVGFIVSIYIILMKENFKGQFKKIIYALFNAKNGNIIIKNTRMASDKFSGFIIGKIIDSLIVGILMFILCTIFKFEYPALMAIIIGVTNIIPVFGPIFGAIPCTIILLLIKPIHALYFVIVVIILQLLDGNVIGPKILGNSTGISSFWVIFAITIFGGFWGVPGMIVGVPLFAVIYAILKSILEIVLKRKGITMDTKQYIYLDHIDPDTHEFIEAVSETPTIDNKKLFRKNKETSVDDNESFDVKENEKNEEK